MQAQDEALLAVNAIFKDYKQNYAVLMEKNEISFASDYKDQFAKVALLACASYFESKVTNIILDTLDTQYCQLTYNFIHKKALTRQYHTLFDWNANNANNFFALFGKDFKDFMKGKVEKNVDLQKAISSFIEIGGLRNKLAHYNYAMFHLPLTVEDIEVKFNAALVFVNSIPEYTQEFRKSIILSSSKLQGTHFLRSDFLVAITGHPFF